MSRGTPDLGQLIVAPHMDDESLGCGGILAKYPGKSVVVALTDSGEQRRAEYHQALSILQVTESVELGFPDGRLPSMMVEAVAALDELFASYRPKRVYLPYPSLHQDHIAAYEAGMRAVRPSMHGDHWYPPEVYVYDIAAYDISLYMTDLRWNVYEALSEKQVQQKVDACLAYASEIPDGPHPMKGVRDLAAAEGQMRLTGYIEKFSLVRSIRP